jgi:DNA-binding CsgD family transcriptional regulator
MAKPLRSHQSLHPVLPAEPPLGLRAEAFELDRAQYLVASYPAPTARAIAGLSKAEAEVLGAALQGLTNTEIALARGRSVFTIGNQLSSAMRKLGVSSRSEAAALIASGLDR